MRKRERWRRDFAMTSDGERAGNSIHISKSYPPEGAQKTPPPFMLASFPPPSTSKTPASASVSGPLPEYYKGLRNQHRMGKFAFGLARAAEEVQVYVGKRSLSLVRV